MTIIEKLQKVLMLNKTLTNFNSTLPRAIIFKDTNSHLLLHINGVGPGDIVNNASYLHRRLSKFLVIMKTCGVEKF